MSISLNLEFFFDVNGKNGFDGSCVDVILDEYFNFGLYFEILMNWIFLVLL